MRLGHREQGALERLRDEPRRIGIHVIDPGPAEILSMNSILFFNDGGDHELLTLHAVFGRPRLTHPVVAPAVVVVRQELVEHAVFSFDSFPGPTFYGGAHRRANMAAGNTAEELLLQAH